ncbi:similar to Saccharomyces cerevisiae YOR083W WHI5 Repressor of G1 transcription that binds to SCB binding factor (SBF) at SCB target promoters in early G1 [Maudiozyma saulgeensis]|uniref:Similar to Saccharomyces cerevisiae YOR083W WHI5 Repressor of G1 transcription that binds to SCB binding factor (SBF) at SCB target promoters in early G1 n=1 Tax=Maudiozyma saulgeensis TaxID=1789683 RepID=A0A1X7QXI4_9SACH|nr:similar to Saccharomyces cerevisiae YOR083W WHI5 Repressor of G1 transcription that binds to SCB binding factor (SBF) at SCB target promoters in early G1 [Kazachstania saulgeensis]
MQGKFKNNSNQPLSELSLKESDRINIKPTQQYNSNNTIMMSPKGYTNDNNDSSLKSSPQQNNARTPRHTQNSNGNNKDSSATNVDYPMTPSPPNKVRRSSASMSFLATPKFNSLNNLSEQQQILSHKKLRSHNSSDNEEEEEEEEVTIPFSPTSRTTRLLPPTTPKSRNVESSFLSPSPHITSPSIYKESNKPIREISNNLKTRLNYAFVKLQNGWVDRTLPELENELDRQQTLIQQRQQQQQFLQNSQFSPQRSIHLSPAHSISSSYTNKFAYGNGNNLNENNDNTQDDERSDSTSSARLAFMKALSSPARGQPGLPSSSSTLSDSNNGQSTSQKNAMDKNTSSSPLKWSQDSRKPSNHVMENFNEISKDSQRKPKVNQKKKEGATEVAAIETLMSLSSPKKSNPTVSFNDNSAQDTENDTEVDESDNGITD